MALTWTNFVNGATNLDIRNAINTFNTAVTTDVNNNSSAIGTLQTDLNTAETDIVSNANSITALDTRVTDLESLHSIELVASSTATKQTVTTANVPLQLEFGAAQGTVTDDVMIDASGNITFNTGGTYLVTFNAHYARVGTVGASVLLFRILLDGVQQNGTFVSKLSDDQYISPWSQTFQITVGPADVLTAQIMKDGASTDSGAEAGIYAYTATGGWNATPNATIQIYKV